MHRISRIAVALILLCGFVVACSDMRNPAAPLNSPTSLQPSFVSANTGGRRIMILDECDPNSFPSGLCTGRNGGLTFGTFMALLQKNQRVSSWRFAPDTIHVPTDMTLPIINGGGETHTFTEVEEFGGGIIPDLNAASGMTTVAPECTRLTASDFVSPGGQTTHSFEAGEDEKYQCCIHPWMRAVTR